MDTRSGRGIPDVPPDEWYPTIPDGSSAPRRLILTVGTVALGGGLLGAVLLGTHKHSAAHAVTAINVATTANVGATTPAASDTAVDPCSGLTGDLVTDKDAGQDSPLHVVAALEYAYYVTRDPSAVTALYAPGVLNQAAIAGIANFIGKIPVGTKYCVSATLADPNSGTVNYDINEVRPSVSPPSPPVTKSYAMALTTTSTAPYYISNLHPRK